VLSGVREWIAIATTKITNDIADLVDGAPCRLAGVSGSFRDKWHEVVSYPNQEGDISCKHSAHARAVMGSAGFGVCYGESACTGGRQGLPSMRSCRASMALRPCLRAVSM
jgi:hypothetical protein